MPRLVQDSQEYAPLDRDDSMSADPVAESPSLELAPTTPTPAALSP